MFFRRVSSRDMIENVLSSVVSPPPKSSCSFKPYHCRAATFSSPGTDMNESVRSDIFLRALAFFFGIFVYKQVQFSHDC